MDRFSLIAAFVQRQVITVGNVTGKRTTGVISALQHEDGSGYSFNVTFECGQKAYVRCDNKIQPYVQ